MFSLKLGLAKGGPLIKTDIIRLKQIAKLQDLTENPLR